MVNIKIYAQVTTVTYMHQSQPSLHLLLITFTVQSRDVVECRLYPVMLAVSNKTETSIV